MEAPYFKEMVNEARYKTYIGNSVKSSELIIKEHVQKTEYLHQILCTVRLQTGDGERNLAFTDQWLFIRNKWYHVLQDPMLFPETD